MNIGLELKIDSDLSLVIQKALRLFTKKKKIDLKAKHIFLVIFQKARRKNIILLLLSDVKIPLL